MKREETMYKITEHNKTLVENLTWNEATDYIDNIENIETSHAIIEEM